MKNECNTRINSKTKRCVLKHGSVGKHLIGRPKICNSIRNPKTNRCIKTTNNDKVPQNTHKKTTRKRATLHKNAGIHPICLPTRFGELANDSNCSNRWKRLPGSIGSGVDGSCYRVCRINTQKCEYVIKIQKYNATAKAELKAYIDLQGTQLIPKMYAAWTYNRQLFLVMERVFPCKMQKTQQIARIKTILRKLEDRGWLHVDIHSGNVGCRKNGTVVLIDFGWAVHQSNEPYAKHPARARTYSKLKTIQDNNVKHYI